MNNRRIFLKRSAMLVGAFGVPVLGRAVSVSSQEKSLNLFNTHTSETFSNVFWSNGQFVPEALNDINSLLRDHRSNQIMPIDPNLLSLLENISAQVGAEKPIHIISAYRSPETNQWLADHGDGIAKHSLHLEGKAIDFRVPGVDLIAVQKIATQLRSGGVGFYADSQFVHIDTGRVRNW